MVIENQDWDRERTFVGERIHLLYNLLASVPGFDFIQLRAGQSRWCFSVYAGVFWDHLQESIPAPRLCNHSPFVSLALVRRILQTQIGAPLHGISKKASCVAAKISAVNSWMCHLKTFFWSHVKQTKSTRMGWQTQTDFAGVSMHCVTLTRRASGSKSRVPDGGASSSCRLASIFLAAAAVNALINCLLGRKETDGAALHKARSWYKFCSNDWSWPYFF